MIFLIDFLYGLRLEQRDDAASLLLSYLTFLRPGSPVKHYYIGIIPKIFQVISAKDRCDDDRREILNLVLMHPAFSNEERQHLIGTFSIVACTRIFQ